MLFFPLFVLFSRLHANLFILLDSRCSFQILQIILKKLISSPLFLLLSLLLFSSKTKKENVTYLSFETAAIGVTTSFFFFLEKKKTGNINHSHQVQHNPPCAAIVFEQHNRDFLTSLKLHKLFSGTTCSRPLPAERQH